MKTVFNLPPVFRTSWVRCRPKPHHLITCAQAYFKELPSRPRDTPRYEEALRKTRTGFNIPKVNPLHINDVLRHYTHPERSPGLPYTTEGIKQKRDVDPLRIKQYVHNMKYKIWTKCRTPCNAVGKGSVHRYKDKVRLIWVYPAHMTYAEGMFAMPLIQAFKERVGGMYAIWFKYQAGHMRLIRSLKPRSYTFLAADWTKFDTSLPAWLIRDAFSILRDCLDFSAYQYWGAPTDSTSLPNLWKTIIHYFINTPLKLPDGRVIVKDQGIPSGSFFTSLIGSVCNAIMLNYLLSVYHYDARALFVYGDDSVTAIKTTEIDSLRQIAAEASATFGATLSVEKSELSEFPTFLGYRFSPNGRPIASYQKLMAQLLLPERRDPDLAALAQRIRALQLASFGDGSPWFLYHTQTFLEKVGMTDIPPIRRRDELSTKLEALGLAEWPPLSKVLSF